MRKPIVLPVTKKRTIPVEEPKKPRKRVLNLHEQLWDLLDCRQKLITHVLDMDPLAKRVKKRAERKNKKIIHHATALLKLLEQPKLRPPEVKKKYGGRGFVR